MNQGAIQHDRRTAPRAGFTLLEVSVAAILLGVLMVVAVQLLAWVAAERAAADRRRWATHEVANVMEQITAQPWTQLTAEHAASYDVSESTRDRLAEAVLEARIVVDPEQPDAKRITVAIRWQPRAGRPLARVALTSWVYRPGGTQP